MDAAKKQNLPKNSSEIFSQSALRPENSSVSSHATLIAARENSQPQQVVTLEEQARAVGCSLPRSREQKSEVQKHLTRAEELSAALAEKEASLQQVLASRSWRLTAPLRTAGRWLRTLAEPGGHPSWASRLGIHACLCCGLLLVGRLPRVVLYSPPARRQLWQSALTHWEQFLPSPKAVSSLRYWLARRLLQLAALTHASGGILPVALLRLRDRQNLASASTDALPLPEPDNGCIRARLLLTAAGKSAPPVGFVFIHVATEGHMFFQEIAQIIACGFEDAGIAVQVVSTSTDDGRTGYGEADMHLVVAPHEFYHFLPAARIWNTQNRLWMLNTEQAHTPWFAKASTMFHRADLVLDMDFDMSRQLARQGIRADHLPLGFSPRCKLFEGLAPLDGNIATWGLPSRIREWTDSAHPLETPLARRPLDCCFFGNAVERRVHFFATHAALFADLYAYLRLLPMDKTLRPGITTPLTTEATCGIVRRSKLALNVHQSHHSYFEWHRIVFQGLWQGALVVSEPCTPAWPFRPNIDYISVGLPDMADTIEYLLRSADGVQLAESIRAHGHTTLTTRNLMGERLKELVELYACISGDGR